MIRFPKIFVICGTPGSGKDILIKAINDLGKHHAIIVPKHTTRKRRTDDGNEMICSDDKNYDMSACEIVYDNYEDKYGINVSQIWAAMLEKSSQVLVVSNIEAINSLKKIFSTNLIFVYVHSEMSADDFGKSQKSEKVDAYTEKRLKKYRDAFEIFLRNYNFFKHVLIYSGSQEDLIDQIFRLLNYYENLKSG
jgi:guanylate kinase